MDFNLLKNFSSGKRFLTIFSFKLHVLTDMVLIRCRISLAKWSSSIDLSVTSIGLVNGGLVKGGLVSKIKNSLKISTISDFGAKFYEPELIFNLRKSLF